MTDQEFVIERFKVLNPLPKYFHGHLIEYSNTAWSSLGRTGILDELDELVRALRIPIEDYGKGKFEEGYEKSAEDRFCEGASNIDAHNEYIDSRS